MNFAGRWKIGLLVGALGVPLSFLFAANTIKTEMTVQLPPFIVETTVGPSWRYTRIPRFEILSRCNDLTTDRLALAFHRANQLLGLILPSRFQLRLDAPQTLIFYDRRLWPEAEQDAVAAILQSKATALSLDSPVILGGAKFPGLPTASGQAARDNFFSNLLLTDADSMTTFALVSADTLNPEESHLTSAYVETLLRGRAPALPAWFTTGFLRLYSRLEFRSAEAVLPASRWESLHWTASAKKGPPEVELIPLANLFDATASNQDGDVLARLAQAELFISWGIDPAGGRAEAFWKFVEATSTEPATADLFHSCFGFGFSDATTQLAAYAMAASRARWSLPPSLANPPGYPARKATLLEIALIKGEWERLETRYVRKYQSALEATYLELARRTLHQVYDRNERDPRLLATLGLLELDAGNKEQAREMLEAAIQQPVVRPRAYFELARLRYDSLWGRSTRNDGKLTPAQAGAILDPLLAAARQAPPQVAVFELMGHVCFNSTEPPSAEVLAVLAEGARLFPNRKFIPDER